MFRTFSILALALALAAPTHGFTGHLVNYATGDCSGTPTKCAASNTPTNSGCAQDGSTWDKTTSTATSCATGIEIQVFTSAKTEAECKAQTNADADANLIVGDCLTEDNVSSFKIVCEPPATCPAASAAGVASIAALTATAVLAALIF